MYNGNTTFLSSSYTLYRANNPQSSSYTLYRENNPQFSFNMLPVYNTFKNTFSCKLDFLLLRHSCDDVSSRYEKKFIADFKTQYEKKHVQFVQNPKITQKYIIVTKCILIMMHLVLIKKFSFMEISIVC